MSESAVYRRGKALRGGIPLCWPWFGAAPAGAERPQHGYARTLEFSVTSTSADAVGAAITLTLDPARAPYPEWQNRLQLEIEIRLSGSLWLEMRSRNLCHEALTLGNALHGYYAISDRGKVAIPALTGLSYLDKPRAYREQRQSRAIRLEGEIDRVYHAAPAMIELQDPGRRLCTSIRCRGNNDLVIWNPGARKARAMANFDDSGFQRMVCIEPANALAHSVVLQPGESHRLGQCMTLTRSARTATDRATPS